MGTLINPTRPNPQSEQDFNAHPTFLRNPNTGIVFKLFHKDTIARCLKEGFSGATEADMMAQVPEFEALQGRSFTAKPAPAVNAADAEPPAVATHRQPHTPAAAK